MIGRYKRISLLTFVAVAVALGISWPSILKYLAQEGLRDFSRTGSRISWSGLSTSMLSVKLDSLSFWVPGPLIRGNVRALVSVDTQSATVSLIPSSIATLKPTFSYALKLYGGSVSGTAAPLGQAPSITSLISEVQLGLHPQLAATGLRGGHISGEIKDLLVEGGVPRSATFDLSVGQLTAPATPIGGLPISGAVLGEINLSATGTLNPESLHLKRLSTSTDFGSVDGTLTVVAPFTDAPTIQGELKVSLAEKGISAVGAWLPSLTDGAISSSDRAFMVRIATVSCSASAPIGQQIPMKRGCLGLTYIQE
jgi:hypothetical protein